MAFFVPALISQFGLSVSLCQRLMLLVDGPLHNLVSAASIKCSLPLTFSLESSFFLLVLGYCSVLLCFSEAYLHIYKHHLFKTTLMSLHVPPVSFWDPYRYWGSPCYLVYISFSWTVQTAINRNHNVMEMYYTFIQYSNVGLCESVGQHAFRSWLHFT